MLIGYNYGNNINDMSDLAKEIIKRFQGVVYLCEFREVDAFHGNEPHYEYNHLFVFTMDDEDNLKKHYFCRYVSYIRHQETEPYGRFDYHDAYEDILQKELKIRENQEELIMNVNVNENENENQIIYIM